jgi:hypothetical protein
MAMRAAIEVGDRLWPILDFGECPPSAQNAQAASMRCVP